MNKLEDVARQVLERERARGCLAETTMDSLKRYVDQMLALAESAGFAEPCQDLYDAFAADDRGSTERRSMHVHVNKLVDAVAGTRAVNPGGMFYNEPDMPTAEEVEAAFGKAGLAGEGAGVLAVVARADAEMARFGLTQSTMGQYRHAWRELAAYLQVKNGSLPYDEAGIWAFADEARKDPRLPEWRRKIRRKASAVLVEVALTGTCEWRLEREGPRAPTEELEVLRADYIGFLRARNLAATTIGLQDWGLRRMLEFSGATTLDDVASFGADQVAAMVGGFSGICTTRSLSTALPVVRRALDYLGEAGFCRAGLSGLVMTPYSQRGGEVTFLPVDDEVRLVRSLQEESARDRAMMLLALRLGLRDSDIRSLRFNEVDWVHDRICLSQQKTGVPLTLPLVPEVGNAIMEYITGERPSSAAGYPYVFVREQAPHVKLTSLYTVCSKALRRSGAVGEEEGPAGMHLLRRTLARRMLEASVTHAVLGDALGHSNPESGKPYISLDSRMLAACALDLSGIGFPAWCGGGGRRA